MSGSGGGGEWRPNPRAPTRPQPGTAGAGSGAVVPDVCNISEVTSLNSANRTVLATLRADDVLDVVFQTGPPQRLVAQTAQKAIAGSITSASMLQIIQCIQSGVSYQAVVLSVRGAQCQIRIEPR